jgi:CHASE2 domain-containing sensor protein
VGESEHVPQGRNSPRPKARFLPAAQAIGWAFVLLVLAGYFAWMVVEMGAHAATGAWPIVGVFAAAVAGAIAATLGLIVGRRGGD